MSNQDDSLRALLRQWRGIEPSPTFDTDVRRRVRLAQAGQSEQVTVAEWLRRLFWQPAVSVGVALAHIIGLVGGWRSAAAPAATPHPEVGFLAPGTLAGSYARLSKGDRR